MVMEKFKGRLAPREIKRLATMRSKYGQAQIIANARKAGLASTGKFTSESSKAINKGRWEEYYRLHPDRLARKLERERKKNSQNVNNERPST